MTKLLLAVSLLMAQLSSFSQNEPYGFSLSNEKFAEISILEYPSFDHDVLLKEDTRIEAEGGRTNFGRLITSELNEEVSGSWKTLANGDRIWQFRFKTASAKGVCVYFNDLYLPIGSSLVLYPADRSYFAGPFGNEDCHTHGHFMMGEVIGDEAILEYYEPASVIGEARIGIHGIGHLYRYVYDDESVQRGGGSEACEVDVNCPEGAEWTAERDAVVRLQITDNGFIGLCSGVLVNTLAKDCRQYILTALHCGEDVSDDEWLDCAVRFKYQRSACTSGSTLSTYNKVGVTHLADSNDGGGSTGSDFLLLELQDPIPATWTPFFAGWSAETTTPEAGVGIHHPSGDRKKISTTDNIVSGTYNAIGFHWKVKWIETQTNWGVTEGGSSGSPLYDQNHHVVGTLTGGLSFCDSPTASDYYGKMSKHWTANPNQASEKLKVWLDPDDTGITSMDGSYIHSSSSLPCDPSIVGIENDLQFDDITIYPSLVDQQLTISTSRYDDVEMVKVYDNSGKLIRNFELNNLLETLSTQDFSTGMYYISFVARNGSFTTKKFAVAH